MEISTKASGRTTNAKEKESISIMTGPNTEDNGRMIYRMDKEWKLGLMEPFMKAITVGARNMGLDSSNGMMVVNIRENSLITI